MYLQQKHIKVKQSLRTPNKFCWDVAEVRTETNLKISRRDQENLR